jgi:hypothetical protein
MAPRPAVALLFWHWRINKNPPRPSAEKITKIAAALGVTSDYLCVPKI